MDLVNELFQNIRFLKFYGWGMLDNVLLYVSRLCSTHGHLCIPSETRWSSRVQKSRETELEWRVKQNIVDVLMTFIW